MRGINEFLKKPSGTHSVRRKNEIPLLVGYLTEIQEKHFLEGPLKSSGGKQEKRISVTKTIHRSIQT
jgi:hypothetical protein